MTSGNLREGGAGPVQAEDSPQKGIFERHLEKAGVHRAKEAGINRSKFKSKFLKLLSHVGLEEVGGLSTSGLNHA